MYAFGKGDEFEEISLDLSAWHIVVVMPPVHVPTAQAYAGVQPKPPEVPLKEVLATPIADWKQSLKNDFEESVFNKYPQIGELKNALYHAGALYASMSGSGSSLYGIFHSKPDLSAVAKTNLVCYDV